MKNVNLYFVSILILFASCSPVKFYSDSGLTKSSGLKYYTVKPYVLIERDPATNNVVKASVLYMPDLEHPNFMAINSGMGARKIDVKLSEGSINTFGLTSEDKISESIEALSALISKTAGAAGDLSNLKGLPPAATAQSITELYEVTMAGGTTALKKIEFK